MEEVRPREENEETEEPVVAGSLTLKQERALHALLAQPTRKGAAEAAGVSDTTLWRYLRNDVFREALHQGRRAALSQIVAHLHVGSVEGVAVIREVMLDKDAPPAVRVSAARTCLDFYIRVDQTEELLTHIDNLAEFIRKKQEEGELDAAIRKEEGKGR